MPVDTQKSVDARAGQCRMGKTARHSVVTWDALQSLLCDLPPEERRIVGQRLDLPQRYTVALGPMLKLPWRITFLPPNGLILLPRTLWDEAIESLRAELCERLGATPSAFATLIVREVADCTFDAKKRLYLPTRLYGHLDFANKADQVIFRPGAAWLEVWPQAVFDKEFQDALAEIKTILRSRNCPARPSANQANPTTVTKSCGPIVTDGRSGRDGKREAADDNTVG